MRLWEKNNRAKKLQILAAAWGRDMEKRKRENGHLEVDEQLYGGPGTSEREAAGQAWESELRPLSSVRQRQWKDRERECWTPSVRTQEGRLLRGAVTGKHCRGWTKPSNFWEEEHISLTKGIVSIVASLGHHQVNRISWGRGSWSGDWQAQQGYLWKGRDSSYLMFSVA